VGDGGSGGDKMDRYNLNNIKKIANNYDSLVAYLNTED
jgi:hypothetical protein